MNNVFAQNLNKLMEQLDIQNAQLAKALNVDPSLVCRWRKEGCGKRSAPGHSIAIERFVLKLIHFIPLRHVKTVDYLFEVVL